MNFWKSTAYALSFFLISPASFSQNLAPPFVLSSTLNAQLKKIAPVDFYFAASLKKKAHELKQNDLHTLVNLYSSPAADLKSVEKKNDFLRTIDQIVAGTLTDPDDLHLKMRDDDIDFSVSVAGLMPYKIQIEYILSSPAERAQIILDTPNLDTATMQIYLPEINRFLTLEDTQDEETFDLYLADLRALLLSGTPKEFKLLLEREYKDLNIHEFVFNLFYELSSEKRKIFIQDPDGLAEIFEQATEEMKEPFLEAGQFNILANSNFQALVTDAPLYTSVRMNELRLSDADTRLELLTPNLSHLAKIFNLLASEHEFQKLDYYLSHSDAFYRTVGMKSAFDQFAKMKDQFPSEAKQESMLLIQLREQILKSFMKKAFEGLDSTTLIRAKKMIDFNRFN